MTNPSIQRTLEYEDFLNKQFGIKPKESKHEVDRLNHYRDLCEKLNRAHRQYRPYLASELYTVYFDRFCDVPYSVYRDERGIKVIGE